MAAMIFLNCYVANITNGTMAFDQNKAFLKDFISIYAKHPALWNVKSPAHQKKHLRNLGLDELVLKCREVYPQADRHFVKRKINNLRTTYRRELAKVRKSLKTSSSYDDVYVPNLWYYDRLSFIDDNNEPERCDMKFIQDEELDIKVSVMTNNGEVISSISSPESHTSNTDTCDNVSLQNSKRRDKITQNKREIIKSAYTTMQNLTSSACEALDECSILGKWIAHQLRAMDEEQRLLAEKITNEVMYYGRMGKLSENSFLYQPKE